MSISRSVVNLFGGIAHCGKEQTMSDYIKRKSIRDMYSCLNPDARALVGQVLIDIDAIPTIDAVSVVRCSECRWSRPRTLKGETGYRCVFYRTYKAETGYCDIGEREGE